MKKIQRNIAIGVLALASTLVVTACATDAEVVSDNISQDADNFKVNRRITAINGITDSYLLTIEGFCNIVEEPGQLEVTCKVGEGDRYKKHFVGISDNVTYVVEQVSASNVSPDFYKVTWKPTTLILDPEAR